MKPPPDEAGFTLIELIISLALFALIALAGLALVESLMTIQARTDGRLDRVATIQRAMFTVHNDFSQVTAGAIVGEGSSIAFQRPFAPQGGLPVRVRYALVGGAMVRDAEVGGARLSQRVMGGVSTLRWRYYIANAGWIDRWPPSPDRAKEWPSAIAAEMTMAPQAGVAGPIRQVVALPVRP